MKKGIKIFTVILISLFVFPITIHSQETSLCQLIGKNVKAVLNKYGKPLHHDKSNPAMECVFYQSKTARMAFIADKDGVYQIQVDYYYNSKKEADNSINNFLLQCTTNNLQIDTLKLGDYKIAGTGVKMNLTLFENTYSKKYEVKFKADRSEIK